MKEPEDIVSFLHQYLLSKASLRGKKVLISAGPTYEYIDPVRFIGNHSSGKMGYALAEEALKRGAEVTLVSGPVSITCSNEIKRINILSAEEMKKAIYKEFDQTDVLIMTAAVADYKPKVVANQKKKGW